MAAYNIKPMKHYQGEDTHREGGQKNPSMVLQDINALNQASTFHLLSLGIWTLDLSTKYIAP